MQVKLKIIKKYDTNITVQNKKVLQNKILKGLFIYYT